MKIYYRLQRFDLLLSTLDVELVVYCCTVNPVVICKLCIHLFLDIFTVCSVFICRHSAFIMYADNLYRTHACFCGVCIFYYEVFTVYFLVMHFSLQ